MASGSLWSISEGIEWHRRLHSGEIVELDQCRVSWTLDRSWRYSSAGSDAIQCHAQLLCLQGQVLGSASLWQRCVGHQMIHVWHAAANNLRNLHCHRLVADRGQP